jgi:hypothetical protein
MISVQGVFNAEYQPEAKGRKHRGFHNYTLGHPLQHCSKSALKRMESSRTRKAERENGRNRNYSQPDPGLLSECPRARRNRAGLKTKSVQRASTTERLLARPFQLSHSV